MADGSSWVSASLTKLACLVGRGIGICLRRSVFANHHFRVVIRYRAYRVSPGPSLHTITRHKKLFIDLENNNMHDNILKVMRELIYNIKLKWKENQRA